MRTPTRSRRLARTPARWPAVRPARRRSRAQCYGASRARARPRPQRAADAMHATARSISAWRSAARSTAVRAPRSARALTGSGVVPRSWSSSSCSRTSSSTPESLSTHPTHARSRRGRHEPPNRGRAWRRGGFCPAGFLAWLVGHGGSSVDGRAGHPYLPGAAVPPFQGADRLQCARRVAPRRLLRRRRTASRRRRRRLARSARSAAGWFRHR